MKHTLFACALLMIGAAGQSADAASTDQLPDDAQWYLHVDLDAMRKSPVGRELYSWLDQEVFEDLRDDADFDPNKELDSVVAYSNSQGHATALLTGKLRQASKDKLLAAMTASGSLQIEKQGGIDYYRVDDLNLENTELDIDQETLFFSFDRDNTIVFSTRLDDMIDATRGNAKRRGEKGTLLRLSAERSLLQAGLDAAALGENASERWNSGMFRQARQLAFVFSERKGNADLRLRVTADDQQTTDSLAAVVR